MSHVLQELDIIQKVPHTVPISAHHKWNFDDLLEMMWQYLDLIRMCVQGLLSLCSHGIICIAATPSHPDSFQTSRCVKMSQ